MYHASYSATKFAIVGLDRALDQELRLQGLSDRIHVVSVLPWGLDTPFWDHTANYSGGTPRLYTMDGPDEAVSAVVYSFDPPAEGASHRLEGEGRRVWRPDLARLGRSRRRRFRPALAIRHRPACAQYGWIAVRTDPHRHGGGRRHPGPDGAGGRGACSTLMLARTGDGKLLRVCLPTSGLGPTIEIAGTYIKMLGRSGTDSLGGSGTISRISDSYRIRRRNGNQALRRCGKPTP